MTLSTHFRISAFGDEIADDLHEQLHALRDLHIGHLELRGAWGTNVLHLGDEEVLTIREMCDQHGIGISCIGSPVGKSALEQPIEHEMANLAHIFQIAEACATRRVRIFSFYPPDTRTNASYDQYVGESVSRLAGLAEMAQHDGFELLLENEKGIVGDTLDRCHAILSAVDSPSLRFLWDPANFVQVGESEPTARGWPSLGAYVTHVHIKDAVLADGSIRPAGEGDGQVGELLAKLSNIGYDGFLALEPHLAIAGHSSGFSGAEGMARATDALRQLMAERGCRESKAAH